MAGVNFRIGDAFPHEDVVSQFLTGLCMVVNDVTLTMRQMHRIHDTREGQSGVNTYYLYLTCAYYREAAHFLELGLKNAEVTSFLADLSPDNRDHLATVTNSFTPWNGSFVKDKLKPIRDVVFHYKPLSLDRMRPYLESASAEESHIELGQGSYLETRYEVCRCCLHEIRAGRVGAVRIGAKRYYETGGDSCVGSHVLCARGGDRSTGRSRQRRF